ncbi:insulinase family protein [Treponema pectinovorum]|uniref:M16 family metallopeptidase n=1 Tax=Treponema pectinovorum TaxID=164 RepID=UPI003D8EE7E0
MKKYLEHFLEHFNRIRFSSFVAFLFFFLGFFAFAQKTSIENLYRYKLENSLELFVLEDDKAPLVYIEIAVRAGAVTQTRENAGLFHLYEHMMFKGNQKYKNQKDFTLALNRMGVAQWNGSTSVDRVNYYFTIPSSLLKEGLEFWSYAIRTPLMDKQELENEKKVVLSEIEGGFSEPGRILSAGIFKEIFNKEPWKLDSAGEPSIVKNATVEQLKQIQKEFYIPKNAALFVGGDVKSEDVFSLVKEIFGLWQNSEEFADEKLTSPSKEPFSSVKKLVFADSRFSKEMSQISYYLRGPDAQNDAKDSYVADVWTYMTENPESEFVQKAVNNSYLNIPDSDYVGAGYSTMRLSSLVSFSATMMKNDKISELEQANRFIDYVRFDAVQDFIKGENGYKKADIQKVKNRMEDERIYSLESAEDFLSELSYFWAAGGSQYFFDYEKNIEKVSAKDLLLFAEKYLKDKNGLAVLQVNPESFIQHKDEFIKNGWQELTFENARWWKDFNYEKK